MTQSNIQFHERRRLLLALSALPATALASGLTACRSREGYLCATVTDRRVPVSSDVSLHVRDWQTTAGNANQVIVLLAGLGANAHIFDSLAPVLARHARVLTVSRRGYGQSSKPMPSATQRYNPETLVADLLAVFDTMGVDRAILAGHSIAGNEITLFAGLHPQRVRGLIYLDTSFDYTQPPSEIWTGEDPPDNPALEEPEPTPADRASMAAAIAFAKRVNKNWWPALEAQLLDSLELLLDGSVRPNTPTEVNQTMAIGAYTFSPDYAAVRAPALVIMVDPTEIRDMLPWLLSPEADAQTMADARKLQEIFRQVRLLDNDRLVAALPGCKRLIIRNAHHSDFYIEYETKVVHAIESMRWNQGV